MVTRQRIHSVRLLMPSKRSLKKASLWLILSLLFNSAVPAFALREQPITERSGLEELGGTLQKFASTAGVPALTAKLEEAKRSAGATLLSFNPAAGLALHNAGLEEVYQVVENADDASRQKQLGFPAENLIRVLTPGMEEADYAGLALGMKFVRVPNRQPGWEAYVVDYISSHSGRRVVPIFETSTLAAGLRKVGIPEPVIQQVLADLEEAYNTLNKMQ